MQEVILDTLLDTVRLMPFLLVTYLLMEWIEHKTKQKMDRLVKDRGIGGPIVGGLLGIFPQCGFSASAANLYAGRLISVGTLIAIFISTSDEMLPILISEQVGLGIVVRILLFKVSVAIVAGIIIDLIYKTLKKNSSLNRIHSMCEKDHCHCEDGMIRSAIHHTVQITAFILLISFVLNTCIFLIGEETLSGLMLHQPVLGPLLAGLVGLIPNCAASVMLTQLYLEGMLSLGAMLSGLIAGSGIGLLVLFKVNADKKENMTILGMLYAIGAGTGILIDLL